MPEWLLCQKCDDNMFGAWVKLVRRLQGLQPGRYQLIITIGKEHHDWTVQELGKVER